MKYIITLFILLFSCFNCYCQESITYQEKWGEIKNLTLNDKYKKSNEILYSFDKTSFSNNDKIQYLLAIIENQLPLNNKDSIKLYLDRLEKIINTNSDFEYFKGQLYNFQGRFLFQIGNELKGFEKLVESQKIAKKNRNYELIAKNHLGIGRILYVNQDLDRSVEYLKKAVINAEKANDQKTKSNAHVLIGNYYIDEKLFDKAEQHLKWGEEVFKSELHSMMIYAIYAKLYLAKGDQKQMYKYALKILQNENASKFFNGIKKIKNVKYETLADSNKYKAFDKLIERDKEIYFDNSPNDFAKEEAIGFDIQLNQQQNQKKKISLLEERLKIRDSSHNIEKQKIITEFDTKYRTQEKEKENLKLQNEATQRELVLANENKQKWIFALSLLGALLTLGIFIFFYRRNRKQKQFIEYLQKEMHHRVKNNLAIINAFIDNANDPDNESVIEEKLLDLQNRIDSIYHIHEQLHFSKNVTYFNVKTYIDTLTKNVKESFFMENLVIVNSIEPDFDIDPDKSFSIGLIINEFLTNSFKHAFSETDSGKIIINMKQDKDAYYLSLSDNGKGLPDDIDITKLKSYGLKIISLLVKQLKGTFLLENNKGVSLTIKFLKS